MGGLGLWKGGRGELYASYSSFICLVSEKRGRTPSHPTPPPGSAPVKLDHVTLIPNAKNVMFEDVDIRIKCDTNLSESGGYFYREHA